MPQVLFCIPCFNEGERLRGEYLSKILQIGGVTILLVDDGSTDDTLANLHSFAAEFGSDRVKVFSLEKNSGKGEAVRQGLIQARKMTERFRFLGFMDADGAISVEDIESIVKLGANLDGYEMIWSSRVALAGREIDRSLARHYIARTFSTLIALFYPNLPYDTQSGLKLFTAGIQLDQVISQPFRTRWLFEIEMLLRWRQINNGLVSLWEEPLMRWRDVPGSKVADLREIFRMMNEVTKVISLALKMKARKGE
jgi:glycosyltransferase involved in cell wall biosynthesis